ncbi:hypothetical protein DZC73_11370 [Albitalea terrae]|uniref:Uncharacterized protein n=2 Tax=Piscinibacter terrae TaxID=2496871 RepID=A0A3N7HUC6_9BURK|nr:hypothetical protein DZC73_11370 [Albitalea terrae]
MSGNGLTITELSKVGVNIDIKIDISGSLEKTVDAIGGAIAAFFCSMVGSEKACKLADEYIKTHPGTPEGTPAPGGSGGAGTINRFELIVPNDWLIVASNVNHVHG